MQGVDGLCHFVLLKAPEKCCHGKWGYLILIQQRYSAAFPLWHPFCSCGVAMITNYPLWGILEGFNKK